MRRRGFGNVIGGALAGLVARLLGRPSNSLIKAAKEIKRLRNSEEMAWGIIANAYGGDWDLASEASGWKAAAERWRDEYHKHLPSSYSTMEAPL